MAGTFDDFANKHEQDRKDRERLSNDSASEWVVLKGFTEALATDGKPFDGQTLEWVSDEYEPRLVIGSVAAAFYDRRKNGRPVEFHIRFDRKPAGPSRVWSDNNPLVATDWTLLPSINGDDIEWMVAELNAELNTRVRFSSAELANQIAIKLGKIHLEYKNYYERKKFPA